MNVAILYNTFSAKGKGRNVAKQLAEFCTANSIQNQLYENDWSAVNFETSIIALVGGDGTLSHFINQFPNTQVPLILFPGGTGNDFYWKIYGERSVAEQFEFLKKSLQQEIKYDKVDVAQCILDKKETKYYINAVGIGFDGSVLEGMSTVRFFGGHLGYYLVVLRKMFFFKEPNYSIKINNNEILNEQPITLLNIANSSRTGGGFLLSPLADVRDGKLNLLYCYLPKAMQRLSVFMKLDKGTHIHHKAVNYQTIDSIQIECNQNIKAQLDGELIAAQLFEIELAAWKLCLVS